MSIEQKLSRILTHYQNAFSKKVYSDENNDYDYLMEIFGITPEVKRENRQYWGRELGMCWQLLVVEICKASRSDFAQPIRIGNDELCDLIVGNYAIDTKYRIGSGDSGTLKKFKGYGPKLKDKGLKPLLLILRDDNLPSAITACKVGGWNIKIGEAALEFLHEITKFNIKEYLLAKHLSYQIARPNGG